MTLPDRGREAVPVPALSFPRRNVIPDPIGDGNPILNVKNINRNNKEWIPSQAMSSSTPIGDGNDKRSQKHKHKPSKEQKIEPNGNVVE